MASRLFGSLMRPVVSDPSFNAQDDAGKTATFEEIRAEYRRLGATDDEFEADRSELNAPPKPVAAGPTIDTLITDVSSELAGHPAFGGKAPALEKVSGHRSPEKQAELYNDFKTGKSSIPAARPGTSRHEKGTPEQPGAVDLNMRAFSPDQQAAIRDSMIKRGASILKDPREINHFNLRWDPAAGAPVDQGGVGAPAPAIQPGPGMDPVAITERYLQNPAFQSLPLDEQQKRLNILHESAKAPAVPGKTFKSNADVVRSGMADTRGNPVFQRVERFNPDLASKMLEERGITKDAMGEALKKDGLVVDADGGVALPAVIPPLRTKEPTVTGKVPDGAGAEFLNSLARTPAAMANMMMSIGALVPGLSDETREALHGGAKISSDEARAAYPTGVKQPETLQGVNELINPLSKGFDLGKTLRFMASTGPENVIPSLATIPVGGAVAGRVGQAISPGAKALATALGVGATSGAIEAGSIGQEHFEKTGQLPDRLKSAALGTVLGIPDAIIGAELPIAKALSNVGAKEITQEALEKAVKGIARKELEDSAKTAAKEAAKGYGRQMVENTGKETLQEVFQTGGESVAGRMLEGQGPIDAVANTTEKDVAGALAAGISMVPMGVTGGYAAKGAAAQDSKIADAALKAKGFEVATPEEFNSRWGELDSAEKAARADLAKAQTAAQQAKAEAEKAGKRPDEKFARDLNEAMDRVRQIASDKQSLTDMNPDLAKKATTPATPAAPEAPRGDPAMMNQLPKVGAPPAQNTGKYTDTKIETPTAFADAGAPMSADAVRRTQEAMRSEPKSINNAPPELAKALEDMARLQQTDASMVNDRIRAKEANAPSAPADLVNAVNSLPTNYFPAQTDPALTKLRDAVGKLPMPTKPKTVAEEIALHLDNAKFGGPEQADRSKAEIRAILEREKIPAEKQKAVLDQALKVQTERNKPPTPPAPKAPDPVDQVVAKVTGKQQQAQADQFEESGFPADEEFDPTGEQSPATPAVPPTPKVEKVAPVMSRDEIFDNSPVLREVKKLGIAPKAKEGGESDDRPEFGFLESNRIIRADGRPIDRLAADLGPRGLNLIPDEKPETLWNAIKSEMASFKSVKAETEKRQADLERDAHWQQNESEDLPPAVLETGDKFMVRGVPHEVVYSGDFEVIVRTPDGDAKMARTDAPVRIDRDSFASIRDAGLEKFPSHALNVGDAFTIQGERFSVAEEGDTGLVITNAEGAERHLPYFGDGSSIKIDKDSLVRAPVQEVSADMEGDPAVAFSRRGFGKPDVRTMATLPGMDDSDVVLEGGAPAAQASAPKAPRFSVEQANGAFFIRDSETGKRLEYMTTNEAAAKARVEAKNAEAGRSPSQVRVERPVGQGGINILPEAPKRGEGIQIDGRGGRNLSIMIQPAKTLEEAKEIASLFVDQVRTATGDLNTIPEVDLLSVSPREAEDVARQNGPDISEMIHTLKAEDIRHAVETHSNPDAEAKHNPPQRVLTYDDLKRIPDVISGYDSIKVERRGVNRSSIVYSKAFPDGTMFYVERVIETSKRNKPRLFTKTAWVVTTAGVESSTAPVYTPGGNQSMSPAQAEVKSGKLSAPAPAGIQDFGEKIGGARKDYAQKLKDAEDLDPATHSLSEVWPEPDYEKLIEGGADPFVVGFARAARDEIPAKPRKPWMLSRWVENLKMMRRVMTDLMNGGITRDRLDEKLTGAGALRGIVGRAELYAELGHKASLKGVTIDQNFYSLYKGEKNVTKWTVERARGASGLMSNFPSILGEGNTREEAVAEFKKRLETMSPEAERKTEFSVYRRKGREGFIIGKKMATGYADLFRFNTAKEAEEFLRDHRDEVESRFQAFKKMGSERRESNVPRIGEDYRKGKDVTPEMFQEAFGFRGVEFGNYVEQGRRQADLNDSFDALMDLAGILNLPTKALSLNGELGLAFGARGKGGVNSPAAHYEPLKVVINLTKNRGPGSLAHEWWHALDNYFARTGKVAGSDMATESRPADLAARGSNYHRGTMEMRDEMVRAFGDILRTVRESGLPKRSEALDMRRSSPYWSTMEEMTARAFENYIVERLNAKRSSNDYLANINSISDFAQSMLGAFFEDGKTAEDVFPYLTEAEVRPFTEAFDRFFSTVKTRDTEKGVALFSYAGRKAKGFADAEARGEVFPGKYDDLPRFEIDDSQMKIAVPEIGYQVFQDAVDAQETINRLNADENFDSTLPERNLAIEKLDRLYRALGFSGRVADRDTHRAIREALEKSNKAFLPPLRKFRVAGELGEVLDHPELFANYPDADRIPVEIHVAPDAERRGAYTPANEFFGSREGIVVSAPSLEEARSVLIHEIQHAIQSREGFASGSSVEARTKDKQDADKYLSRITQRLSQIEQDALRTAKEYLADPTKEDFVKSAMEDQDYLNLVGKHLPPERAREMAVRRKILKESPDYKFWVDEQKKAGKTAFSDPYKEYRRSAGEIEARDVQNRMSNEAARALPPYSTEDIARENANIDFDPANESRSEAPYTREEFDQDLADSTKEWGAGAPKIQTVDTTAELAKLLGVDVPADAEGAYVGGKVYLVRENIGNRETLQRVLAHEAVGHFGLEKALGKDYRWFVKELDGLRETDKQVAEVADKVDVDYRGASKQARQFEVGARLAEIYGRDPQSLSERARLFVEKLIGHLQDFARSLGFDVQFNAYDVSKAIQQARAVLEGKPSMADLAAAIKGRARKAEAVFLSVFKSSANSLTDTPEFKRWFGESKVVDEAGAPKVVYHGTARGGFSAFDTYGYGLMGPGAYFTENPEIASTYTSKGKRLAERTGGATPSVYPVFLKISKPLDMDGPADLESWKAAFPYVSWGGADPKTNADALRAVEEHMQDEEYPRDEAASYIHEGVVTMGFDGITHIGGERHWRSDGTKHRVWIAFDPAQIKSATGNTGSFSPESHDIRFSIGPSNGNPNDPILLGKTAGRGFGETTPDPNEKPVLEKIKDFFKDSLTRTASEKSLDDSLFHSALAANPIGAQSLEEIDREMKVLTGDHARKIADAELKKHIRNDNDRIHAALSSVLDTLGKAGLSADAHAWVMKKYRRLVMPFLLANNWQKLMFRVAERIYWNGREMVASPGLRVRTKDGSAYEYAHDGITGDMALDAFKALPAELQKILVDRAKTNEQYRQRFVKFALPMKIADVARTILTATHALGGDLDTEIESVYGQAIRKLRSQSDEDLIKAGIDPQQIDIIEGEVADAMMGGNRPRLSPEKRAELEEIRRVAQKKLPFLETDEGHYGYVHHMGFENEGPRPGQRGYQNLERAGSYTHPWFEEIAASQKKRGEQGGFIENLVLADIAQKTGEEKARIQNEWMLKVEDRFGIAARIADGKGGLKMIEDQVELDQISGHPGAYVFGHPVIARFGNHQGQMIFIPESVYAQYQALIKPPEASKTLENVQGVVDFFTSQFTDMINTWLLWHPTKAMRDMGASLFHVVDFLATWPIRHPGDIADLPGMLAAGFKAVISPSEWQKRTPERFGEYSESLGYLEEGRQRHWSTWMLDKLGERFGNLPLGTLASNAIAEINLAGAGDLPLKRFTQAVGEYAADKRGLKGAARDRFIRQLMAEYAFETSDLPPLQNWARGKDPTPESKVVGALQRTTFPFFGYTSTLARRMMVDPFTKGIGGQSDASDVLGGHNRISAMIRPAFWMALAAAAARGFLPGFDDEDESIAANLQNRPGISPDARTSSRLLLSKTITQMLHGEKANEYEDYISTKGWGHPSLAHTIIELLRGDSAPGDLVSELATVSPAAKVIAAVFRMEDPYSRGVSTMAQAGKITALALAPQMVRFGPDIAKIARMTIGDKGMADPKVQDFWQAFANQLGIPAAAANVVGGEITGSPKTDRSGQKIVPDAGSELGKYFGPNVKPIPVTTSKEEAEREARSVANLAEKIEKLKRWQADNSFRVQKSKPSPADEHAVLAQLGLGNYSSVEEAIRTLEDEVKRARLDGLARSLRGVKARGYKPELKAHNLRYIAPDLE